MISSGFSPAWLDELKSKNDIVETISRYVHLEQKGKNVWGCCPFHSEKTPSFSINPIEQYYHCFGCGVGGDVIRFVMEIENLTFYETIKLLADRVGMIIPEISGDAGIIEQKKQKDKMIAILTDAAEIYHNNLSQKGGEEALKYLARRKISDSTISKFGIGVSLGFNDIITKLESKGYDKHLMQEAGIANSKDNKYYDHLWDRIIIPIYNHFGDVIAFGGRELIKSDVAKYKNTATTPVFDKSNTLYGLNFLRKLKTTGKFPDAIMVEGYMDTISLVQAGIENVVASMGTALTTTQARLLKRYVDKVYICYDGDGAGQAATLRGLDILAKENIEVMVMSMPEGLDPDDTVKQFGAERILQLKKSALPLTEYKLYLTEKSADMTNIAGRTKYANAALNILKSVPNIVEREAYLPMLRDKCNFSIDSLKRQLGTIDVENKTVTVSEDKENKDMAYYMPSRFILFAVLNGLSFSIISEDLLPYLEDDEHREIYRYIEKSIKDGKKPIIGNLFSVINETTELNKVLEESYNEHNIAIAAKYFKESLGKLKNRYVKKKIEILNRQVEEEKDIDVRSQLYKEIGVLSLIEKNMTNG